jgi:hypothetical protein
MDSTLKWRKSARSSDNGGACVETARVPGGRWIAVRDSKNPDAGYLALTGEQFTALLADIKAGKLAP